jgi:uncharacterized membrane protein
MKTSVLVLLLVCFLLVGATAAALFYTNYVLYDVKELPMAVKVSNHIGFNLTTDVLQFGRVTSPGSSDRWVIIANSFDQKLMVHISGGGYIGKWVTAENRTFVLEPGTQENVKMSINVPPDVPEGDYSGTLRITFTRLI